MRQVLLRVRAVSNLKIIRYAYHIRPALVFECGQNAVIAALSPVTEMNPFGNIKIEIGAPEELM